MKAPTYILKRVYLERNQERELKNHEKRLQQIQSSKETTKSDLKKKTKAIQEQQEQAKKNHERATQFKIQEKQREQIAKDKILMKKLVEINNQTSIPTPSSKKSLPNLQNLTKNQPNKDGSQRNASTGAAGAQYENNAYGAAGPTGSANAMNGNVSNNGATGFVGNTDQSQIINNSAIGNQGNSGTQGAQGSNGVQGNNVGASNYQGGAMGSSNAQGGAMGSSNAQGGAIGTSNAQGGQSGPYGGSSGGAASGFTGGPSGGYPGGQDGRLGASGLQANNSALGNSAVMGQSGVRGMKGSKSAQGIGGGSVVGLHSVGRKREEERINLENLNLANRMVKLPPVISQKKLEADYKKNKQLGEKILRFHHLKKKAEKEYDRLDRKDLERDEIDDGLDPNDEKLMNQRVQLYVNFTKIEFINFLPQNCDSERYFMEIKASVRAPRTTTPEMYDDFAKSVVNEFFYLKELRKSKLMYLGLYQVKDGNQTFLGDFEIDLTPYYMEGVQKAVKLDLRNFKELYKRPAYMPTDMRRKGGIDFDLKITSKIKQYLDDLKLNKELAPEVDVNNQKDWSEVQNR